MKAESYSAAGAVVFDDSGRVLVLERRSRFEVRLPKGHVDAGEEVLATARRETAEEAGYADLEPLSDLGVQVVTYSFDGRDVTREERYFAFRLASDRRVARRPKDDWQFRVLWLAPDEALAQLTFDAEREWVRRAIAQTTALEVS